MVTGFDYDVYKLNIELVKSIDRLTKAIEELSADFSVFEEIGECLREHKEEARKKNG